MTTNIPGRLKVCLQFLAILALSATTRAQQAEISIPDGPRHFIVLVDSSWSMIANSMRPAPPSTKREALATAERYLASLLYEPGRIVKGPWYRSNRDLVSIVHYGIDHERRADMAYIRLKDARLDEDYARLIERANPNLSRERFLKALRPTLHTNLNVLAWALPVGLAAARVPTRRPVEETFVILLNDMQMNDGSMVLEANTLGMHLSPSVREELARKEKVLNNSVRLTDRNGQTGVWLQKTFGEGADLIAITAFKATPVTTNSAAGSLTKLRPLDSLDVEGGEDRGVTVRFDPGKALIGVKATVRIQADQNSASKSFVLSAHSMVNVGRVTGQKAKIFLLVTKSASNPLLGTQTFRVLYEQPALLPSGSRVKSLLVWFLGLAAAGVCLIWIYYQALLARHFRVLLPEYISPFVLPPISQRISSRQRSKHPVTSGGVAAVLVLPSRFIRAVFYRNATLKWDPRLRIPKLPADASSASLRRLPTYVEFIWQEIPSTSGEFELSVERPAKNGRNQRSQVVVRFLTPSIPPRPSS